MAQVAFSIRMDEDVKRDFSAFCDAVGMSMSTAFDIFARKTLSERQIPFTIGLPKETDSERRERIAREARKSWEEFRRYREENNLPELTMEEIDAEIALARKERRERKAKEAAAAQAAAFSKEQPKELAVAV